MAYTKTKTQRYDQFESTLKTSYSHSSKRSTSKSTSSTSNQRQSIESGSKNRSYDYDEDNFIESYLQAERREIGTTPITFKSIQSPRASRRQMQSPVKDGFQKVTVTSGSNKIDHFGKSNTFSSDEDDDVFVPTKKADKRQSHRQYVDEEIIVAQDSSGYDMSGERSFEEIYGADKTAQFQKGQQINFHFDVSKKNDKTKSDVFVPTKKADKRQSHRQYVDEEIIVAQDASGYDMSGERSFEEIYGADKTAQFQKGQQINFHFDVSKKNDKTKSQKRSTPEIKVEQYQTPPEQRKKAWHHQEEDDDGETIILTLASDDNESEKGSRHHHQKSSRKHQQRQQYSGQHSISPRDQPSFKQDKQTHYIYVKNMSQQADRTDSSGEITVPIDVTQTSQHKNFHVKDLPIDITVERDHVSLSEPDNIRVLVSPTPQQNFGFVPVHKHVGEQHHHHYQKTYEQDVSYQNQQEFTKAKVKTNPSKHPYQTDEPIVVNVYESFQNVDKNLYDGKSRSHPNQQTYEYRYTGYDHNDNSVSTAHAVVKQSTNASVRVGFEKQREEQERYSSLRQEELEIQRQQKEIYERQKRIQQKKREEMERREEEERRLIQQQQQQQQQQAHQQRLKEEARLREQKEMFERQQRIEQRNREEMARKEEEERRSIQQRQQQAHQQRLKEEAMLRQQKEIYERMIREEEERKKQESIKIEEERQRRIQEKKLQEENFQRQVMDSESRRRAEEEYQMQQYSKSVQRSQSQRYATTESQNVSQNFQSIGTFPRKLKKRQQQYMSQSVTNTPNQHRKFANYPYSASNTPEVRRRGMSDGDSNPNAILGRTEMGKQSVMVSRVVRPKSVDPSMQAKTLPKNFERSQSQNWLVENRSENQTRSSTVRNIISSTSSSSYQQTSRTTRHGSSSKASQVQRPQSTTAVDDARLAEAQRKYLAKHALLDQNEQAFRAYKSTEHSSTTKKIIRPIPYKQPANKGFMPISTQEFVPQQQFQKGHMVQYGDHSTVKIISGSHLESNSMMKKHVRQSEQAFNRNQQTNKSVQSKAYTNLYRPCPHITPANIHKQQEQAPQRKKSSNEKYESIKVVAKGGVITLSMEEDDKNFTDAEKQRLVSSMYEKQYHQDSSYSEQRYQQSSNTYESYNYQDVSNDDWYQTNSAKILSLKEGNPQFPTENIYYTVCTRYFKPENNDWITSIHRMGKAKVPAEGNHRNKCVFWLQLYDPDKEDIVVQKIIPPAYNSGVTSGNYQRYDDNNNYIGNSSHSTFDDSYDALDATQQYQQKSTYSKRHRGNTSFDSDGESRASSVYSFDSQSSRKRSKPKLLRKSRENPGLYKQEQNDYKKYMPINQTVY